MVQEARVWTSDLSIVFNILTARKERVFAFTKEEGKKAIYLNKYWHVFDVFHVPFVKRWE